MTIEIPAPWKPVAESATMFDTGTGFTVYLYSTSPRFICEEAGSTDTDDDFVTDDWSAVLLHVAPIGFGLTKGVAA